ncbi:MAG: hypothetical protein M0Z69_04095 [Actinomycetota bacterium]|nr:hypothetical protein [Actinomycetota bacterium]
MSSARSTINSLEQRITAQGVVIEKIVLRYGKAQAHEAVLSAALKHTARLLLEEEAALARERERLRLAAVNAYVTGGGQDSSFALLSASAQTSSQMQVYEGAAAGNLDSAVTSLLTTEHSIQVSKAALLSEHEASLATLREIRLEKESADAALRADEALLESARGNLHHLLVLAAEQRAAAERARERALANHPAPAPPPPPPTPAPSPPPPSPPPPPTAASGYVNPLSSISGLTPERIDQGVDYSGFGPIVAIGSGIVLSTYNGGWPGGTFITYRLTSGPGSGLVVYAAEDIVPSVSVGQAVSAGTQLGTMYEGPSGIETGWASGGTGDTMAMVAGQFSGSNSTAFGANFSQLLVSVGAPPGVLQNNPPTGTLPNSWPTW